MTLKFFRGLAVKSVELVEDHIRRHGMEVGRGRWEMDFPDLQSIRQHQGELLQDLDVDPRVRFPGGPVGICATGCVAGATYYALQHNAEPGYEPLLIEFEAPACNVYVDGRDFLYSAFQRWDQYDSECVDDQHATIGQLFGSRCAELFLLATKESESRRRINLATIAVTDPAVLTDHYANVIPLGGRSQTQFCSAFIIRGPVPPNRVVSISKPDASRLLRPEISLQSFLCEPHFRAGAL